MYSHLYPSFHLRSLRLPTQTARHRPSLFPASLANLTKTMEIPQRRRDGSFYYEEQQEEQQEEEEVVQEVCSSSSSPPSNSSSIVQWSTPSTSIEKEHMFDKVVTPSDVGKLNRLVIPKQYAERFFPLDASTTEKGLLLNFEDRTGKPWRFRYSYWNSSQSYVMTKGWSRFVKEKRLDAGDTVSFGRGVGESGKDHLFIDWKRRPEPPHDPPRLPRLPLPMLSFAQYSSAGVPWAAGRFLVPPSAAYDHHHRQSYAYNAASAGGQYLVFRPTVAPPAVPVLVQAGNNGAAVGVPMVLDSLPVVESQAAAKRVRLFGVNLDCPELDGSSTDAGRRAFSSPSSPSMSSSPGKEQQPSLDLEM